MLHEVATKERYIKEAHMAEYIFTEDEWQGWSGGYSTHTLVGIDDEEYRIVKSRAMDAQPPGASTYDRLLGVNTFGPGGVYEAHAHETPMFYYVLKGKALMRVGDEERIVEKGAWVYTPPGLKHYTENVGDDDLAYLFFGGNPKRADSKAHTVVK